MREYELVYVIQPDATTDRESEIHQRIEGVISGSQGRILLLDDWGKRRLAYDIANFQKGHYFQLNFLSEGKEIGEIERLLRIDADVLRFLTILADEEVQDIDKRVSEAAKMAEEQARRREQREREREQREEREREAADRNDDDDDFRGVAPLPVADDGDRFEESD